MVNLVVKSWLNGFSVVRSDSTKKMFSGASILITGASRGLGLEMVRQLAVRYRTCSTLARMLLSGASILITGANMGLGLEMIRQLIARYLFDSCKGAGAGDGASADCQVFHFSFLFTIIPLFNLIYRKFFNLF